MWLPKCCAGSASDTSCRIRDRASPVCTTALSTISATRTRPCCSALNEQVAVAIAHGYAKVTDEPICVIMHSNVGLMNGIMGIYNAWVDRVPIYMMGATGPHDAAQRTPWIHWIHTTRDQAAMIRHFIKWDDTPGSAAATDRIHAARQYPRPHAALRPDLRLSRRRDAAARARWRGAAARSGALCAAGVARAGRRPRSQRAADLLLAAKNPVIMAGRVSRSRADWDRRVRLAELLGASVVTDVKTAAAFPTDHKLHCRHSGRAFPPPAEGDWCAKSRRRAGARLDRSRRHPQLCL